MPPELAVGTGTGGVTDQEAAYDLRLWSPATDAHSSATSHASIWIKRWPFTIGGQVYFCDSNIQSFFQTCL